MNNFVKSLLISVIGSVVANLVVLFALRGMVNNPAMPLHSLAVAPVAFLTVIGVLAATAVYAVMRSVMKQPDMAFIWLSVIVLIVSFIPDYLIVGNTTGPFAGATLGGGILLMLMHVVAAVIVVWSLVKVWGAKAAV